MSQRTRIRLLADYLAATRNEIAVDEMLLGMAHLTPAKVGYLPRTPNWLDRAIRTPALTRTSWRIGRILWLAGGAIGYFALEMFKFERIRARVCKTLTSTPRLTEGAVLGLSTRVCDVLDPERFPWLPSVWLTCPWAEQHSFPKSAVELPLMSLVDRNDLLMALVFSIRATYLLTRDPIGSRWALQSYTAFRWFLARFAIDKIAGTLVTTEHFDRWAVLVDRSVRSDRRNNCETRRLVLVQHGVLGGLGSKENGFDLLLHLPTRLTSVDELHTYNPYQEAIFRRAIISKIRRSTVEAHYFNPTIMLSGTYSSDHLRVLFVGHPLCEAFQATLYTALKETLVFEGFYKPHPKATMSASVANVGWTLIENPMLFPQVELLVSYPSTLVVEYDSAGIPASVHPIDIGIEAVPRFRNQVIELAKKQPQR